MTSFGRVAAACTIAATTTIRSLCSLAHNSNSNYGCAAFQRSQSCPPTVDGLCRKRNSEEKDCCWGMTASSSIPLRPQSAARNIFRHHGSIILMEGNRGGGTGSDATSLKDESTSDSMFERADSLILTENLDEAFGILAEIYSKNPNTSGLNKRFQNLLSKKVDLLAQKYEEHVEDHSDDITSNDVLNKLRMELCRERMGLSSLYIDSESYEEASKHLKCVVRDLRSYQEDAGDIYEKAVCLLYRCQAATCDWSDYESNGKMLQDFLQRAKERANNEENVVSVPPIHPFEALKWPCVSLEDATFVARQYSRHRAVVAADAEAPMTKVFDNDSKSDSSENNNGRRIRLGYISPDFTGNHPLAFLMQGVFNKHNTTEFEIFLYTLSKDDGSSEVRNIRDSVPEKYWVDLTSYNNNNLSRMVQRIREDDLDIMIDLCGHSGTSTVMEIMSSRVAPFQISYMGFPGSSGASEHIDYLICDDIVVPPSQTTIRQYYSEKLLIMPHCYFVNSHKYSSSSANSNNSEEQRQKWDLPKTSFVFCCHSRPDKIDPVSFQSWMKVLQDLNAGKDSSDPPKAVLWLLKSGNEMENNLRSIAKKDYGLSSKTMVFCDVAPRNVHLERLKCADLFLDTPAYNAHTVGCDCLWAGVPMVSLLLPSRNKNSSSLSSPLHTDKLPSRVGSSLLRAVGLHDKLVAQSMEEYESIMRRCVLDSTWFRDHVLSHLKAEQLHESPLFDTTRWVKHLETGLKEILITKTRKYSEQNIENDVLQEDIFVQSERHSSNESPT